jgi:hypothetical protein
MKKLFGFSKTHLKGISSKMSNNGYSGNKSSSTNPNIGIDEPSKGIEMSDINTPKDTAKNAEGNKHPGSENIRPEDIKRAADKVNKLDNDNNQGGVYEKTNNPTFSSPPEGSVRQPGEYVPRSEKTEGTGFGTKAGGLGATSSGVTYNNTTYAEQSGVYAGSYEGTNGATYNGNIEYKYNQDFIKQQSQKGEGKNPYTNENLTNTPGAGYSSFSELAGSDSTKTPNDFRGKSTDPFENLQSISKEKIRDTIINAAETLNKETNPDKTKH